MSVTRTSSFSPRNTVCTAMLIPVFHTEDAEAQKSHVTCARLRVRKRHKPSRDSHAAASSGRRPPGGK